MALEDAAPIFQRVILDNLNMEETECAANFMPKDLLEFHLHS